MNSVDEALLCLIRMALGRESGAGLPQKVPWNEVYQLSIRQNVVAIAADGLSKLYDNGGTEIQNTGIASMVDDSLFLTWLGQSMVVERLYSKYCRSLMDLNSFYSQHGLKMIILKGYALSLDYPVPSHRAPGDIDIFLQYEGTESNEPAWQKGDALIHETFGVDIDAAHEHHTSFVFEQQMVENHYDFINTKSNRSSVWIERELKTLSSSNLVSLAIPEACPLWTPSANFNALFLMRHSAQHFAGAHIELRHLLDWGLFVEHHSDELDWEYVVTMWERMGLLRFAQCVNTICVEYLGLNRDCFSQQFSSDNKLVQRILEDVLHPEFDEDKPQSSTLLVIGYKIRRFWANGWKRRLVFKEGLLESFVSGSLFHLRHFDTIED